MRIKIHGTWPSGDDDSIIISADSLEELRQEAYRVAEARGWTDCWSEEIEPIEEEATDESD
jgi:hypothetical protein